MKFTCQVEINDSLDSVIKEFSDSEKLKYWQDGFVSKTTIVGNNMATGSKSEMKYLMRGQEMLITETVLDNKLPDYFYAKYDHKHTENTMLSKFSEKNGKTIYKAEIDYYRLSGFMVNLIAFIYPKLFKKQVDKWMQQFKAYIENKEND